jgi:hypothetical protein
MSIDFPSSPVNGQRYSYDLRTWEWDGVAWILITSGILSYNIDGGSPNSNYGGSTPVDGGGVV